MEWCNNPAIYSTKVTKPESRLLPPFCDICSEQHALEQFPEKYFSETEMALLSREEYHDVEAVRILRRYCEERNQLYAGVPRRPKIFQPILLYNSYKSESSQQSSESYTKIQNSDGNLSIHLQNSHSKITRCNAEEHNGIENLLLETDGATQPTSQEKVRDYENINTTNYKYCPPSEDDSLASDEILHEIQITSNQITKLNSAINFELKSDNHRSAFSKPRPFQVHGSGSSNMLMQGADTCMEDYAKLRCHLENNDRNIFGRHCCYFPQYVHCDSDISTETQKKVLELYGNRHESSARHSESCFCANYFVDWRWFLLYSHLTERHQSPIHYQTYDCLNSLTPAVGLPVTDSHFLGDQTSLSIDLKPVGCNASDPKLFICQLCSTACTTAVRLKNHLKIHSAERQHKCECGRAFARNEELTRHKHIHSGHRPYHCLLCGKTFGRKDHLNKHQTTHLQTSEKKVHVCDTEGCQQRYTRSDALARHQWAAHGIRARLSKWRPHP